MYAAGRLDADSEGLLVLTSNGRLQQQLTNPRFGHWRTYWVQVEGTPQHHQLQQLRDGITVQGYRTRPAKAAWLKAEAIPTIRDRIPPIRVRATIPTHWLEISLMEGRNRQVRRMTAAVGLPTLRLVRHTIDLMDGGTPLTLKGLEPGAWRASEQGGRQLVSCSCLRAATRGTRQVADEGDGPKLDSFHFPPGILAAIGVMHLLKAKAAECIKKCALFPSTTNTAAPEIWIVLKVLRHKLDRKQCR